jgi:hypothetical protein
MKLDHHIAYRFLTDDSLAWEMVDTHCAGWHDADKESNLFKTATTTYDLLRFEKNQRNYYITDSLLGQLEYLKVNRATKFPIWKQHSRGEVVGELLTYDWTIFKHLGNRKITFIFPDNKLLRMVIDGDMMAFCHLTYELRDWDKNDGHLSWTMFWVSPENKSICDHWLDPKVQVLETLIYRLLCFMYLSENEEVIVNAGGKMGTRKSGKILNNTSFAVTVVTSKWNITSVRTEGFDVSGHFRLQPTHNGTKLILIQPFRKHGYVRKAKSESEK